MTHQADKVLARALVEGDEKAFDEFFSTNFPRLYRFAYSRLDGDEELVRDIVQTTLLNAMRGVKLYKGEASMFTWLCQICRNEISSHFRKVGRSPTLVPQEDDNIRQILEAIEADPGTDPDAIYEGLQIRQLVQEVLDHLPGQYGNVLEWKYIEGFSVSEIAHRLQTTELAAQSMLARARPAFKNALLQLTPHLVRG